MKRIGILISVLLLPLACSKSGGNGSNPVLPKPTPAQKVRPCPAGGEDQGKCTSLLLTLRGRNGQPPNANDKAAVTKAVGSLITGLKTQNYILFQLFPDGGFNACMDLVPNGGWAAAVDAFGVFRVGSDTLWDIVQVESCTGGGI